MTIRYAVAVYGQFLEWHDDEGMDQVRECMREARVERAQIMIPHGHIPGEWEAIDAFLLAGDLIPWEDPNAPTLESARDSGRFRT